MTGESGAWGNGKHVFLLRICERDCHGPTAYSTASPVPQLSIHHGYSINEPMGSLHPRVDLSIGVSDHVCRDCRWRPIRERKKRPETTNHVSTFGQDDYTLYFGTYSRSCRNIQVWTYSRSCRNTQGWTYSRSCRNIHGSIPQIEDTTEALHEFPLTRTSHQLSAPTSDMTLRASLGSISLLDVSNRRIRLRGLKSQA